MFKVLKKEILNSQVKLMVVDAPDVAKKVLPGQFIMLRVNDKGERIPLTVADFDRDNGTVTIIFQEVGKTTKLLGELNEGEYISDFTGPLGIPSHTDGLKKVAIIGGGLGCAIAYPQAKQLHSMGVEVDLVAGFRTKELIILEDAMKKASSRLFVCTDDGSYGTKGFVTDMLKKLIEEGNKYDEVIAIGPLIMMKFISKLTKEYGIKTVVSMNSIMIDGTGMCGCCRLTVAGKVKFACVDGPDFDGHEVDFDESMRRAEMYKDFEREQDEKHTCRLGRNG